MKINILLLVIAITIGAHHANAGEVTKVEGSKVWIKADDGEKLAPGDKINILGDDLDTVASGEVKKISGGKSTIIVELTSGKAKAGQKTEAAESKASVAPSKGSYSDLSEAERKILDTGEISTATYVIGGVLGTWPIGLGVGHAIQGRYADKGWIFTVGELGSLAVALAGVGDCDDWSDTNDDGSLCDGNDGLILAGIVGFIGFRVWEIVDVWAAPLEHNRRYHQIKQRTQASSEFKSMIIPKEDGAMLVSQFSF